MSLRGFQLALSELVMKPGLRRRIAEGAGVEEALGSFELSERERRRLEALARDGRLKTGTTIHRSFRLSMLANTLPRTCKVLAPAELKPLVHAYWRETLPRSLQYVPEAWRFAEFALARIREGAVENPYVEEVLELELATLALGRARAWEPPEGSPRSQQGEAALPAGIGESSPARLRLHPACRIVRFRHSPEELLAPLAAGQAPPAGLAEGEYYLLLISRGEGRVDFRGVPLEQGRVMAACLGTGEGGDAEAAAAALENLPERTGLAMETCREAASTAMEQGWIVS